MRSKIAKLSLAFLAFGALSFSQTQPVRAAVKLGSLDFTQYCSKKYPSARGTKAVLAGSNAYAWRCRMPTTIFSDSPYWDYNVDTNDACRSQYGGIAYSKIENPSNPYSWVCYR
jgi:hypothetical protein